MSIGSTPGAASVWVLTSALAIVTSVDGGLVRRNSTYSRPAEHKLPPRAGRPTLPPQNPPAAAIVPAAGALINDRPRRDNPLATHNARSEDRQKNHPRRGNE